MIAAMPVRRRPEMLPLTDPAHVPDAFASGFEVQDFEDWLRLIGWADYVEGGDGNGGARIERRKAAGIVIPRSSVPGLLEALLRSIGPRRDQQRHS